MSEFYRVGEAITTPCDIKYKRQVVRLGAEASVHFVTDKVFAGTEGVVQTIYTDSKRTVLQVKFLGHRQHVTVVIKGEAHTRNPLVSEVPEEAQNQGSEAPEESEAENPPTPEQVELAMEIWRQAEASENPTTEQPSGIESSTPGSEVVVGDSTS